MPTENNVEKLLKKSIEASNRTTHAIRALVRFLFIQLSFLTMAFLIWQIGLQFPDEDTCTVLGCQPNWFVTFVVGALIVAGVILSSRAGWYELGLSEVPGKRTQPETKYPETSKKTANEKSLKDWLKE